MTISAALAVLTLLAPEVQRPRAMTDGPTEVPAPAEVPVVAEPPATEPPAPDASEPATAEPATAEPATAAAASSEVAPAADTPARKGETFRVSAGNVQDKAPYYTAEDVDALRKRHGLPPAPAAETRKVRWHCLIGDPLCGFNVEVQAMGAFAARLRQGDVREKSAHKWSSGRAQYDVWFNIPVLVETRGKTRYTRMTLGPKAGAIFSDTGDTWGNIGLVGRYWLGRGRFAPAIEFSSAMAFKLARRSTKDLGGAEPKYEMQRGPVGVTGDVGISIGGFAALVVGGQYDSPLAREDVPESFRTQAAGMFFVGLRGNILWGAPAAAAVLTHGMTQRYGREAR